MTLFWVILAIAVCVGLAKIYVVWRIGSLRKVGIYPAPGQATDADIERLVQKGLPTYAMRCHRELYGSSLREAKEAVANLRKVK